jgi:hypothetical protein
VRGPYVANDGFGDSAHATLQITSQSVEAKGFAEYLKKAAEKK